VSVVRRIRADSTHSRSRRFDPDTSMRCRICRIDLAPGKYTYRFLVDGVGLTDPANPDTEDVGNGHLDSVVVITPK
jgi:hypothetical protein